MNKNHKRITIVVVSLIVAIYLLLLLPSDINLSYSGVMMRLGQSDSEFYESINIELDGEFRKDLLFRKRFVGIMRMNGVNILNEYDDVSEVMIDMTEQNHVPGSAIMMYYYGKPITKLDWPWIGNIMFSDNRESIVISVDEDGVWSEEDGLVIVAPADNRRDALKIVETLYQTDY